MKIEIIFLLCIIFLYNYYVPPEYVNNDITNSSKFFVPLAMLGLFSFLVFVLIISSIFYYRTLNYVNHFKDSNLLLDDNNTENNTENNSIEKYNQKFMHIKKINLSIPNDYRQKLLDISVNNGIRIEIPQKRQKCISLKYLQRLLPEIVDWYKKLPPIISKIIGTKVKITPLTEPNSLCLVVYEKEGDFIDWHFDTNHYNGRFFTLLLPVSTIPTCGNYQYRNSKEATQTVVLEENEALLFEGDKIYHKAKKLCANQRRVILSCTFTTSQKIPTIEYIFQTIKNLGIFGEL
jgi:hypothetical protein